MNYTNINIAQGCGGRDLCHMRSYLVGAKNRRSRENKKVEEKGKKKLQPEKRRGQGGGAYVSTTTSLSVHLFPVRQIYL